MADDVTFGAYSKWLSGPMNKLDDDSMVEIDLSEYARGQIAGLESLFQRLENAIEDMQEVLADTPDFLEEEDSDGDKTPSGD